MWSANSESFVVLLRSFRARIIFLITVLVVLAQAVSFLAVLGSINTNVETNTRERLARGATIFDRLVRSRHEQLLQAVSVLSSDFGFKAAAASRDEATIESALRNHGSRIGADIAALLSLEGEVIASTSNQDLERISNLVSDSEADTNHLTAGVMGNVAHLFVIVPLRAPIPVAQVIMGFAIDEPVAMELSRLTGLGVSIAARGTGSTGVISTVPEFRNNRELKMVTGSQARFAPTGYFTHSRPLDSAGGSIHVLLHRSVAKAMQPYEELRLELFLITCVAAGAAVIIGVIMARGVTHPVAMLVAAAKRIRQGDYTRTLVVRSADELGMLARTLDGMQAGIAEREARIRRQATYDELTGLPNRSSAKKRLASALTTARDTSEYLAVLVIGLTGYRAIAESLGIDVGDDVLRKVAHRLKNDIPAHVVAARLDGEEFVVLARGYDADDATALATQLRSILGEPVGLRHAELRLDVAIGVSLHPTDGDDADTLIRRAQIALRDASKSSTRTGRYELGRDTVHLRQLNIVADLTEAAARGELSVHYQPKVELARPDALHAEALMRWNHPTIGFIPPDEFIELAERSGNIRGLTNWLIETVAKQISRWRYEGLDVEVSINLSALDLADEALPERIARSLQRHDVPTRLLALELTESAALDDAQRGQHLLATLRDAGHRLAIDDFGTGFSSLEKLKELPVHEVKIDKGFVVNLKPGSRDETIVRSTIDLAHGLGLETTAEGVENEVGLALLKQLGCDRLQGYHLSRPLGSTEVRNWFIARREASHPKIIAGAA